MKPENDPNYENRLNEKIKELMKKGGDYYPFDTDNFFEAMQNFDHSNAVSLVSLTEHEQLQAGLYLRKLVTEHWERLARIEAEARLEDEYNSCERCGGQGCSKCEKDHD